MRTDRAGSTRALARTRAVAEAAAGTRSSAGRRGPAERFHRSGNLGRKTRDFGRERIRRAARTPVEDEEVRRIAVGQCLLPAEP
jgi:hypothetical protein